MVPKPKQHAARIGQPSASCHMVLGTIRESIGALRQETLTRTNSCSFRPTPPSEAKDLQLCFKALAWRAPQRRTPNQVVQRSTRRQKRGRHAFVLSDRVPDNPSPEEIEPQSQFPRVCGYCYGLRLDCCKGLVAPELSLPRHEGRNASPARDVDQHYTVEWANGDVKS